MPQQTLQELLQSLERELLHLGYPELKRQALENAHPNLVDSDLPDWNTNPDLMSWLSQL